MDSKKMMKYFLEVFPENEKIYLEHLQEYGELLQHVFYSDTINIPLFELLKTNRDDQLIIKYCTVIEQMWQNGDESVKNVVDVTILEKLSDNSEVWQNFGQYISSDFKRYINEELLKANCAMWHVEKLR